MREPRSPSAAPEYHYRRHLSARELLPAIGVGVGVGLGSGLVAFYLARLFAQRTPLRRQRMEAPRSPSIVPRTRD